MNEPRTIFQRAVRALVDARQREANRYVETHRPTRHSDL
jgi:hypothetical protein